MHMSQPPPVLGSQHFCVDLHVGGGGGGGGAGHGFAKTAASP